MIGRALEIAIEAHDGQVDKLGKPYIEHVIRVAAPFHKRPLVMATAFLHDVLEDTPVSLREIEKQFPRRVARAVDAITRRDGESLHDYLTRVKSDNIAELVKRSDIADNADPDRLLQLDDFTRRRLREKYVECLKILAPL